MATKNENLENLDLEQMLAVSERYMMGWTDLMAAGYGFRLKGLNRKRVEFGFEPLSAEGSLAHRIDFVKEHFTDAEIERIVAEYLVKNRMDEARWQGIELFGCRFSGKEYVKAFKALLGSARYRKMAEDARVAKLTETQIEQYGGVGLAGAATKEVAKATVTERYGVGNVMQNPEIAARVAATNEERYGGASPFCDAAVQAKAEVAKWQAAQERVAEMRATGEVQAGALKSRYEEAAFGLLVEKFGRDDVLYEYGIHPSDARYPHNCDFYIRSLDLFIELNCHYSHGNHWFDADDKSDVQRRDQLLASSSARSRRSVITWCEKDVTKRRDAQRSGVNFLVFWDGSASRKSEGNVPNLSDFKCWFFDYDCDVERFIRDHPENSY